MAARCWEFIQLCSMYLRCCTTCGSSAVCRVWNWSAMTSAGRKGKAIIWRQTWFMWSSVVYKCCSLADWTFRQTACPKWLARPRCITPSRTFGLCTTLLPRSLPQLCVLTGVFGVRWWVRETHTYNPSCDVATSWWTLVAAASTAHPSSRRHARETAGCFTTLNVLALLSNFNCPSVARTKWRIPLCCTSARRKSVSMCSWSSTKSRVLRCFGLFLQQCQLAAWALLVGLGID